MTWYLIHCPELIGVWGLYKVLERCRELPYVEDYFIDRLPRFIAMEVGVVWAVCIRTRMPLTSDDILWLKNRVPFKIVVAEYKPQVGEEWLR